MELIQNNAPVSVDFTKKLIIGISGKKGTGKSTVTDMITYKMESIGLSVGQINFADALKDEAAKVYGFDRNFCNTQEGKLKVVEYSMHVNDPRIPPDAELVGMEEEEGAPALYKSSVRRLLQYYATDYVRSIDPFYWVKKTKNTINEVAQERDVIILADMRFPNEYDLVASYPYNYLIRIEPHPRYVYTPESHHTSETALDNGYKFDDIFHPKFGKFYLKLISNQIYLKVAVPFHGMLKQEDVMQGTRSEGLV